MKQPSGWNPQSLLQSPLFAPLHPVLARLKSQDFPALSDFNALLADFVPPIAVQSGKPLRFVAQQRGKLPLEAQYEPRCYLHGEVQTREANWHDLFNALVWLTFPKAKAAVNARHYRALVESPEGVAGTRGRRRDMLTLLDESGVIVVYTDVELRRLLLEFQWKELFWRRREQVNAAMEFHLFGHGLYEKAMQPYIGMTGQGLLLKVAADFFSWSLASKLAHLDDALAQYLNAPGEGMSPGELTPVPLLGIPGWWDGNTHPEFYDDRSYFRLQRLSL